uniref:Uncharacterized protein n=2 Tax=Meloidogyne TaxID=189290 RepID=A0A6V7VYM7_MELEN|nr:unnamed protein product [Meloidogyne enterolobii]
MFKLLIIIFLIIKTHSWTWYDYPSPRHSHLTCGLILPSYVCDPNFMLKNDQRRAIVELVEDFKEKTKRPNSTIPCMREGLRLVVAIAKNKIGPDDTSSEITVCFN